MKNKLQLIAGGLAGVLVPLLLLGAYAAWGTGDEPATAAPRAPIPAPSMASELATTRPTPSPEPAPPPAPAPEPEVDRFAPELVERGLVRVRRLVVASGVEHHEPIGAADAFAVGGQPRLYAFVDAVNETGAPVALDVTFVPASGESTGHVALDVPAGVARWRTWAFTRHVYETGRWEAVVRGPDGRVLARRPFEVTR